MHTTTTTPPLLPTKRPAFVWVISIFIFYFISTGWTLLSFGVERASAQVKADEDPPAAAEVTATPLRNLLQDYKAGESWPARNFQGLDFLEPLVPRVAVARRDVGRIILNSALPYALLTSAFAAEGTDGSTLATIKGWGWAGLDKNQNNDPFLFGLLGLAAASIFLPEPGDDSGYSWALRLDRATAFTLGVGIAALETEILKPVFHRMRPNGDGFGSRPSGHATIAFASMAFLSNIVRDTLRPQDEPDLGVRILKDIASAVPYLGAGYMALERVHSNKHFLTDTLLGGAIGVFTTDLFYAWSFTRREQGRGWLDHVSVRYDPERRGVEVAIVGRF